MTHFLSQLKDLEGSTTAVPQQSDSHVVSYRRELSRQSESLKGKVVLDLTLDPDPYNLHSMSLVYRLAVMGWV